MFNLNLAEINSNISRSSKFSIWMGGIISFLGIKPNFMSSKRWKTKKLSSDLMTKDRTVKRGRSIDSFMGLSLLQLAVTHSVSPVGPVSSLVRDISCWSCKRNDSRDSSSSQSYSLYITLHKWYVRVHKSPVYLSRWSLASNWFRKSPNESEPTSFDEDLPSVRGWYLQMIVSKRVAVL